MRPAPPRGTLALTLALTLTLTLALTLTLTLTLWLTQSTCTTRTAEEYNRKGSAAHVVTVLRGTARKSLALEPKMWDTISALQKAKDAAARLRGRVDPQDVGAAAHINRGDLAFLQSESVAVRMSAALGVELCHAAGNLRRAANGLAATSDMLKEVKRLALKAAADYTGAATEQACAVADDDAAQAWEHMLPGTKRGDEAADAALQLVFAVGSSSDGATSGVRPNVQGPWAEWRGYCREVERVQRFTALAPLDPHVGCWAANRDTREQQFFTLDASSTGSKQLHLRQWAYAGRPLVTADGNPRFGFDECDGWAERDGVWLQITSDDGSTTETVRVSGEPAQQSMLGGLVKYLQLDLAAELANDYARGAVVQPLLRIPGPMRRTVIVSVASANLIALDSVAEIETGKESYGARRGLLIIPATTPATPATCNPRHLQAAAHSLNRHRCLQSDPCYLHLP